MFWTQYNGVNKVYRWDFNFFTKRDHLTLTLKINYVKIKVCFEFRKEIFITEIMMCRDVSDQISLSSRNYNSKGSKVSKHRYGTVLYLHFTFNS